MSTAAKRGRACVSEARHPIQRTHRSGRRKGVRACVQAWVGRYRIEAVRYTLSIGPGADVDQGEEHESLGLPARVRRDFLKAAPVRPVLDVECPRRAGCGYAL